MSDIIRQDEIVMNGREDMYLCKNCGGNWQSIDDIDTYTLPLALSDDESVIVCTGCGAQCEK